MTIFVNPRAGGQTAGDKWSDLRHDVLRRLGPFTEIRSEDRSGLEDAVAYSYRHGERRFIAAGGDGTVNAVLNALMRFAEKPGFAQTALGAIGIGSSNDFHKENRSPLSAAMPYRIDFTRVRAHDVGRIDARCAGTSVRRYFLVNASLGVTAEGNALFNRESGLISWLKRIHPGAAIPWAALSAIFRHVNAEMVVSFDSNDGEGASPVSSGGRRVRLSNLSVMKNPNISGGLRAGVRVACDDGRLGVWMEEGLSRIALLKLFLSLATGKGPTSGGYASGGSSTVGMYRSVKVRGNAPFPLEYDGEVMFPSEAAFSIIPGALEVCR